MGIAGGVDKDAENILSWQKLGAGFVEVGTVTPQPQSPNPGKIMDRNNKQQALWNKMGFPSKGLNYALEKIKSSLNQCSTPLFANIGKNRNTPNESAHEDYIQCIQKLESYVDAFVINISSPNTSSLRELLEPENLKNFLSPIAQSTKTPLLLKISPDISDCELEQILNTSLELNVSGWILTNTTTKDHQNYGFPNDGGLSGKPLAKPSIELLKKTIKLLGPQKKERLIISAGGIITANDVQERLKLGADLIQTYSGLVFEGPHFFKNTLKEVIQQHVTK